MVTRTPHDPLGAALDDLRLDVEALALAPAAGVRERGDRRTRHRRITFTVSSVAAVAAIAVGTGLMLQPTGTPLPAPPATGTTSPTPSGSATTSASDPSPSDPSTSATTVATPSVVDLSPVGVGTVSAAYFLPGKQWSGPDLNHGAAIESIEPKDFEGSVQYYACDPDTDAAGDVAILQAAEVTSGTFVGTQKVRLLQSPKAAANFAQQLAAQLPDCQERLRKQAKLDAQTGPAGETAPVPNATVVEDKRGRVDDATGSVRIYRTTSDYGTGAGSATTQWVVLAREGSAVTSISINQLEGSSVTFGALRRIAVAARAQIRAA